MRKFLFGLFLSLALVAGCNNGPSGPPPISVAVSPSTATVEAGGMQAFTATVTNDSSNKGVTWAVSCSAASCGSVSPASTASGTPTTYTAPAAPPSSNLTVTITATSVTNTAKAGSATITVPAITVSVSPSSATVQAGGSKQFTPTVANDPANAGVTWSVSCSAVDCGSVSPTSTASGTATTYTAPATPPSSNLTVTVTATSATDGSKSAAATVTVPAVTVSVSPSSQTVDAGGSQVFTATVSNTTNTSVTWTLKQGATLCAPACGMLSSSTTNPVTYSAPTTPPASDESVTIVATSVADATKSGSAAITVPAVTVSVSPSTATVEATMTKQFTATVNNTSNTGVVWSLTCTATDCGMLSSTTANPVTYTGPAAAPSSNLTVTITATSSADVTKSGSATITVPAITVSVSPSSASVVVSTTKGFTATVANDPNSAGVTWALTQSGSACSPTCGTLTSVTTTSVTYNAPASVPTPAAVTLTAKSITDTSKSADATITVTAAAACGSGSESLLNGHYAFLLKGFDNEMTPQPALVGGVITVDGAGHVTSGATDMNLSTGVVTNQSVTSGSYSIGSDHRGCMTLTTSAGTQDYRFSVGNISSGVASTGHMIDFDTTGPFTAGVLRKQDTTAFAIAVVTGNYAFGVSSAQNTANGGGKFAAAGVFNFSIGSVTGGEVDFNQNGKLDDNAALTTFPASGSEPTIASGGTYTIDATSGRGTLTFTPSGASAPVHAVIYVVSSSEVLVLGSDPQTTNSLFAGTALLQSGGSFSNSTLNGTSVLYDSGLGSSPGTTKAEIGLVSTNGTGSFSFSGDQNSAGSFKTESVSGTYSVDTTGRVLLPSGGGTHPPLFYIVSANEAFFLDGGGSVNSGFFEPQSAGPFMASSTSGTYAFGAINPEGAGVSDESGVAVPDGVSAITGTSDNNSAGTLDPNGAISATYSIDSNGLGHIPSGCTISATSTTCDMLFLVVSPSKLALINVKTTSTNPKIDLADK